MQPLVQPLVRPLVELLVDELGAAAPSLIPAATVAPVIAGSATNGATLTVTPGTWTNSPDYTYFQWKRDGVAIFSATGLTYILGPEDDSADITCMETAVNVHGAGSSTSNTIGPITTPEYGIMASGANNAWSTASTTVYGPPNGRASSEIAATTYANVAVKHYGADIVLTDIRGKWATNARTSDTAFEVCKNGSTTGLKTTVPASSGATETPSVGGPVTITAGDTYAIATTTGAGAGNLIGSWALTYYTAGQIETVWVNNSNVAITLNAGQAAQYGGLAGGGSSFTTGITGRGTVCAEACTLRNWRLKGTANTLNADLVCEIVKQSGGVEVPTGFTITIPAGSGAFDLEKTSGSLSCSADDILLWKAPVTAIGSGSITFTLSQVDVVGATSRQIQLLSGGNNNVGAGTTRFTRGQGGVCTVDATEAQAQTPFSFEAMISRGTLYVAANASTTTVTTVSRLLSTTAVASGTVSIAGTALTANTVFKDTTHSDRVAIDGKLGWQTSGGTTGNFTLQTITSLCRSLLSPLYWTAPAVGTVLAAVSHCRRIMGNYGGPLCNLYNGSTTTTFHTDDNGKLNTAAIVAFANAGTLGGLVVLTQMYDQTGGTNHWTGANTTGPILDPLLIEDDGLWPAVGVGFAGPSGGIGNNFMTIPTGVSTDRGDHAVFLVMGAQSNIATSGSGPQVGLITLGAAAAGRVDINAGNNDFDSEIGLNTKWGTGSTTTTLQASGKLIPNTRAVIMSAQSTLQAVDGQAAPNIKQGVNGSFTTAANTQTAGAITGGFLFRDAANNKGGGRFYGAVIMDKAWDGVTDVSAAVSTQLANIFNVPTLAKVQGLFIGSSSTMYRTYGRGVAQRLADRLGPNVVMHNVGRAGTLGSVTGTAPVPAAFAALLDTSAYEKNFVVILNYTNSLEVPTSANDVWNNEVLPLVQQIKTDKPSATIVLCSQPSDTPGSGEYLALRNLFAANQVAEGYVHVDLPADPRLADRSDLTYFDADLHPNATGADAYAELIQTALEAAIPGL